MAYDLGCRGVGAIHRRVRCAWGQDMNHTPLKTAQSRSTLCPCLCNGHFMCAFLLPYSGSNYESTS